MNFLSKQDCFLLDNFSLVSLPNKIRINVHFLIIWCTKSLLLLFFPPYLGTSLLHSSMLDLDSDVRPSPIGHLSQTASLKRGSSFQSGRNDGGWLFCLETCTCIYLCPLCCTVRKQTETPNLCVYCIGLFIFPVISISFTATDCIRSLWRQSFGGKLWNFTLNVKHWELMFLPSLHVLALLTKDFFWGLVLFWKY